MKFKYALIYTFLCLSVASYAQPWSPIRSAEVNPSIQEEYIVEAEEAAYFTTDLESIRNVLQEAPLQGKKNSIGLKKVIELPLSDGSMQRFYIAESPVMQSGLQAKYPDIRTYKGYAIDNPLMNVRLDINKTSIHAAIHSTEKITYIDPQGDNLYVSYDVNTVDYNMDPNIPFCGVDHDHEHAHETHSTNYSRKVSTETIPIHQYRVAIACTGEFGKWKGTKEKALADIVTGVNRMNQIFENELSMRLVIVDDNDKLFFFDKNTDPYTNTSSGGAMISINTNVINGIIGSDAYDLGHVYSRSCDVGGIAALSSMCTNIKGNGCTCHYRNDIDYMAASVTAHEIGHQMSAQHTFNNCTGDGNEALANGFEPGSGSTIMSYGGLCGSNNVVQRGDDHYHNASLTEIYNHLRNGGIADGCAEKIPTENVAPVIKLDYKNDFYIPTETYFFLEGSATDANNDPLTYSWEQMNAGQLSPLGNPKPNAPNFRCFKPTEKPYRFFSSPKYILANIGHRTEVMPKNEKQMKFNFVVRDNHPTGGYAVWEQMRFWVTPSADGEKFGVSNFKSSGQLYPGQDTVITWNVAHTADQRINCQSMDLYMFSGSAQEFNFDNFKLIKKNIPNTGSYAFKVPNFLGNNVKFILKASNNIFFDTNDGNIQILDHETPTLGIDYNNDLVVNCIPNNTDIEIKTYAYGGLEGMVEIKVKNELPEGVNYSFSKPSVAAGESTTLTLSPEANVVSQEFEIIIEALVNGVDTVTTTYPVRITNDDHSEIAFIKPAVDATGISVNTDFNWKASPNATTYDLVVGTSPSFEESTVLFTAEDVTENNYTSSTLLEKNSVYYWKVVGKNECGKDENPTIGAFATEVLSCTTLKSEELPVAISSSGKPEVEVILPMNTSGAIADVNVRKLVIDHSNNKDMTISIVHPDGDAVTLVDRKCNQRNVNCSFDDSANEPVKCPLNNGKTYRPQKPLSAFNNKDSKGNWKLRVKDHKSGNGGRIKEVDLEVCANASLNAPTISVNEGLETPPSHSTRIRKYMLEAVDNDNDFTEIIYTIVTTPTLGNLTKDGEALGTGGTFTQADIHNGFLRYAAGEVEGMDNFTFTVNDGAGGFVGITTFSISIDKEHDADTSTEEQKLSSIAVYPNPASSILTFDLGDNRDIQTIKLYDVLGNEKLNVHPSKGSINVENMVPGVYIVVFSNGVQNVSRRVSIL